MTPEQFAARARELSAQGVAVEGNAGTIQHSYVTLDWAYNGTALTVTIARKPMFVPESVVEGKIRGWFAT